MPQIQYDGYELEHFDSAKNFRKYQLSLIKNYLKGSLLEVGAGKGGFASVYKNYLKNITLIEPDIKLYKILLKKFKKKINIKNYSISNVKNKFDVIIYFDVLEHIEKDLSEIKLAKKKLKSGGILIFSVPAYQLFYSDFDKSVGHFKRYNKKDFLNLSKKSGLKLVKLVYYDSIGFLFLLLNKILFLSSANLKYKIKLWNFLIPLSRKIDKLIFNKFGKSLLCVMKK